jgi:hypothetical protein
MTQAQPKPLADDAASQASDYTTSLLGVVAIVGGVATGLFPDLRFLGQLIGLLGFVAWVIALGLILWGPRKWGRRISALAFGLTALLLLYAFVTGPRLSSRTLILAPTGLRTVNAACPGVAQGSEVSARVALNQLGDQFIHIEVVEPGCEQADEDIRIRSEDLQAVTPAK